MAAKPYTAVRAAVALESLATSLGGSFLGRTLSFDPAVTLIDTAAQDPNLVKGGRYIFGNRTFKYVKFVDAVAYAQGQIVFPASADGGEVTNDVAGGSSLGTLAYGVVLGVQTQNHWGFVQINGPGIVLHNNDDDAAAGSEIIATAADGGVCNVGAQTIALGVGIGLAAVVAASNLQSAWISIKNG